jgi:hypothetical protein
MLNPLENMQPTEAVDQINQPEDRAIVQEALFRSTVRRNGNRSRTRKGYNPQFR